MISTNYNNYLDNLRFLYGTQPTNQTESPSSTQSREQKPKECLGNYFYTVTEELNDRILANRLINKRLVKESSSKGYEIFDFIISLGGVITPALEIAMKAGNPINPLVPPLFHLIEKSIETLTNACKMGFGSSNHQHQSFLKGAQVEFFINSVGVVLTYNYHHEILNLSETQAKELAARHAKQIVEYLNQFKSKRNNKTNFAKLVNKIQDHLDPDPDRLIQKKIASFIFKRNSRLFCSTNMRTRECYLITCLDRLLDPNYPNQKLIERIRRVLFYRLGNSEGTKFAEWYPNLSTNHHCLSFLRTNDQNNDQTSSKTYRFKAPFWTYCLNGENYYFFYQLLEDMNYLLIRRQIRQRYVLQDNIEIANIIESLPNSPQLNQLKKQVENNTKRIIQLEKKVKILEDTVGELMRTRHNDRKKKHFSKVVEEKKLDWIIPREIVKKEKSDLLTTKFIKQMKQTNSDEQMFKVIIKYFRPECRLLSLKYFHISLTKYLKESNAVLHEGTKFYIGGITYLALQRVIRQNPDQYNSVFQAWKRYDLPPLVSQLFDKSWLYYNECAS